MIEKLKILTDTDAKLAYASLGVNGFMRGIGLSDVIQVTIGVLTILILLPRAIRAVRMLMKGKDEISDSIDPFDTDRVQKRPEDNDKS